MRPALQSLYHVMKAVPSAALQCLGRFRLLFRSLSHRSDATAQLALQVRPNPPGFFLRFFCFGFSIFGFFGWQVIHLACQQKECVVDVAAAQVLGHLLRALRTLPASLGLALDALYTLLSHTPIVKECLAKGGESTTLLNPSVNPLNPANDRGSLEAVAVRQVNGFPLDTGKLGLKKNITRPQQKSRWQPKRKPFRMTWYFVSFAYLFGHYGFL